MVGAGLALILLSGCGATSTSTGGTPTPTPILPNLLVEAEGQVEVRREGSTLFVPIGLGAAVQLGDTLRVAKGSKAAVFCGDEALWAKSPRELRAGREAGVPCVPGSPSNATPDVVQLRGPQAGATQEVPYALSPRAGYVLEDRPTLRWHMLDGVDTYTVTISSTDHLDRPAVTAHGGELAYPADWPPLEGRGADYTLIVEGGGRRSDEGQTMGLGFSLLDGDPAALVLGQVQRLRERPLSEPALALLLAELYLRHHLHSDAAQVMEDVPGGDQVAAVQNLLGDTYLEMGLFAEARGAFERALALSQGAGLPEAKADAHYGLGLAACGLWDWAGATAEWEQAQAQYQALEQKARVDETAGWLAAVTARCSPSPTAIPGPE